jgi:hypothetical protein
MEKPREFWVDDILNIHRPYQRTAYLHYQDTEKFNGNIIHVIEHRAYQKLQEENKKLREALEFYACGNHMRKETVRGRIIEYDVDAGPLHEVYEEYIHNEYPPGRTAQQALKEGEEA